MQKLHFPQPDLRLRSANNAFQVWDVVRKKWVALTPEEWVRQHLVHFLRDHRGWPEGLMEVEKNLRYNGLTRRADVVIRNSDMKPVLVAECKAPDVNINQAVLDQAALYNRSLGADYLLITNGLHTSCCHYRTEQTELHWLSDVPFGARQ